jgi:hypothetical protein
VLREKRGHHEVMSAELERTGEAQISLTDPDCRAMAAHTKVGVGYNIQAAVDAKHKMIVEQTMGGPNSHMIHMFRSDAASRWRRGNIAYIFVWK